MSQSWKKVVAIAAPLPGVTEGTSYGTPALRVATKFLTRYRPEDDTIVIKLPFEEREMRMEAAPHIYFITDHYRDYPSVLVRLATVSKSELTAVLTRAWREAAPKKLLKETAAAPAAKAAKRRKAP